MDHATPPADRDRAALSDAALNRLLAAGGTWVHGPLTSVRHERIGTDYGLSGRVYRVAAIAADGSPVSLVAKFEPATEIGRAVAFRMANASVLGGLIPASYGAEVDHAAGQGVILLEDIHPATQGDDLLGCSRHQALDIAAVVANVHASTRKYAPHDARAAWGTPVWETDRWQDRLRVAAARYPDQFTTDVVAALSPLNRAAGEAIGALATSAMTWVHRDSHPDNVLWRDDGSPVLIDWSGAEIGPPAIDLAVLLTSLTFRANPPLEPEELLARYADESSAAGVPTTVTAVTASARRALVPHLRGMVGWVGIRATPAPVGRHAALRDVAAGRVVAALRWLGA